MSIPEDKIKYLKAQTMSLELQIAHRCEMSASTAMEYESMKKSLDDTMKKYEQEKQFTIGLTRDMTRQYKGMQDELLNKINAREKVIQDLTDTLSTTRTEHEKAIEVKDDIIREKEKFIRKLQGKMEDMCADFAAMIRGALVQMKERIEVQSADFNETNVPIQHRMEEFNFKAEKM